MDKRKTPLITVDGIVLVNDKIVLVKRLNEPFKGCWALPGGFVEYGETVEKAVKREIQEETGLKVEIIKLVGVYSDPNRDPRGHVISICFLCKKIGGSLRASTDAREVSLFDRKQISKLKLAFDHDKMISDAGFIN